MYIKGLIEKLRTKYEKVLVDDQIDSFLLTIYEEGSPRYILCIPKNIDRTLYAKIESIDKVNILECSDFLYSPQGIYLFAKDQEEFIEKLDEKIKFIGKRR